MPTNQEISAWLAQRGVQATPQNANIAARIMGADAIASRGATDQGAALDASGEINRLYDQLNTRSMGPRRPAAPRPPPGPNMDNPSVGTPLPNAAAATPPAGAGGGITPSPNALGATPDELEGGMGPAAIAAMLGIPVAAVVAYMRGRGGGAAGGAGAGGLPAVPGGGGGPAVPSGGGGTPPASGATPLVGRPVPGASAGGAPALPTPAPQLPPPALALPSPASTAPPSAAGATAPIPPRPEPQMPSVVARERPVTASQSRVDRAGTGAVLPPEQSIMRRPPRGGMPGAPSPIQQAQIDAQLSRQAGPRVAGRPTPSPATQATRSPTGVHTPARRGRGGYMPGRHSIINPNTRVF